MLFLETLNRYGIDLMHIARVMPFLAIMLLCLLAVTYIPAISLFLPNWLLH